ncbi:unnamed protein product, partial [Ectocarpus sp. 4 AP-2014]
MRFTFESPSDDAPWAKENRRTTPSHVESFTSAYKRSSNCYVVLVGVAAEIAFLLNPLPSRRPHRHHHRSKSSLPYKSTNQTGYETTAVVSNSGQISRPRTEEPTFSYPGLHVNKRRRTKGSKSQSQKNGAIALRSSKIRKLIKRPSTRSTPRERTAVAPASATLS